MKRHILHKPSYPCQVAILSVFVLETLLARVVSGAVGAVSVEKEALGPELDCIRAQVEEHELTNSTVLARDSMVEDVCRCQAC